MRSYRLECIWPLTLLQVHRRDSFPSEADGNLHIELPRQLAGTGQIRMDLVAHRALLLSHLERLGLQINLQKGHLSPRQRMVFLGKIIDSAQLQSSQVYWLTIQWLAASLKPGTSHSLMLFQRLLSLMVASLAAPPILAQSLSPVPCLASGPVLQSKQPLWPPGQLLACFSQAYSWDWAPEGRWSHSCGAFMSGASTGAWAAPNESEQHQFWG